jgi:short-subunit dehydrogenase
MAGWSDVLAVDLHGTGVRVHLVNPGPIETEIWDKLSEPAAYTGKLYPASAVATAIRGCLERGTHERFVPRSMAVIPFFKMLMPRTFIRSFARFDRRADHPGQ